MMLENNKLKSCFVDNALQRKLMNPLYRIRNIWIMLLLVMLLLLSLSPSFSLYRLEKQRLCFILHTQWQFATLNMISLFPPFNSFFFFLFLSQPNHDLPEPGSEPFSSKLLNCLDKLAQSLYRACSYARPQRREDLPRPLI